MEEIKQSVEYQFSAKDKNVEQTVEGINQTFDKLGDTVEKSTNKMGEAQNKVKRLGNEMKKSGQEILYMEKSMSSLATTLFKANTNNDRMANSLNDIEKSNRNVKASISSLNQEFLEAKQKGDMSIETVNKLKNSEKELEKTINDTEKKLQGMKNKLEDLNNTKRVAKENLIKVSEAYKAYQDLAERQHKKYDKNKLKLKEYNKALEEEKENLKQLKNAYNNKDEKLSKNKTKQLEKQIESSKEKIKELGLAIRDANKENHNLKEGLKQTNQILKTEGKEVKQLTSDYERLIKTTNSISNKVNIEEANVLDAKKEYKQVKDVIDAYDKQTKAILNNAKAKQENLAQSNSLASRENTLHNSIQKKIKAEEKEERALNKTSRAIQEKTEKIEKSTRELEKATKTRNLDEKSIEKHIQATKKSERELANFYDELLAGTVRLERLDEEIQNNERRINQYKERIEQLTASYEELRIKTGNTKEAQENYTREVEKANKAVARLETDNRRLVEAKIDEKLALENTVSEYEKYANAIEKANNQTATSSKSLNAYDNSFNKTSGTLNKVGDAFTTVGDAGMKFSSQVTQVGRNIESVGQSMAWMTMAGATVFGTAIKSGMEFDEAMANLASTIDTTELGTSSLAETMSVLEAKVRGLAKQTIYNPTEVAEGMKYLSLAGYSTVDMLSTIEPMLKMAQIGNMDLAQATDLLTDAMASYRMEVSETGTFLDAMAKLQASSNTNVAQATEAFIWAGGSLADYNVSLEESSALLGILANQGLKGAQAGRSLSSILVNLTKDSGESAKALQKLHDLTGKDVFAFDKKGNHKGVANQIKAIKEALDSLNNDELENTIIQSIAGKTQMKTFTKLLGQINGEYDELTEKVKNSNGALNEMHDIVSQSNFAKFKEMLSAIQEALLQIWDTIQPLVMYLVEKITQIANNFSKLSDEQQLNILKMLGLVAVVPLLIVGFGKVIQIIGNLGMAIFFCIKIIGMVINGISFLIGVIGNVFGFLKSNFTAIIGFFKTTFGWIVGLFGKIVGVIKGVIALISGLASSTVAIVIGIVLAVVSVVVWFVNAFKRAGEITASVPERIGEAFKLMGEDIAHFFISIYNGFIKLMGKLTRTTEDELDQALIKSKKDLKAMEEGYDSHSDKKKKEKAYKKELKQQEKQQKELLKQQKKANKEKEKEEEKHQSILDKIRNKDKDKNKNKKDSGGFLDGIGDIFSDGMDGVDAMLELGIDDGGFFSDYAEFKKKFEEEQIEITLETRIETDTETIDTAEKELKALEDEFAVMRCEFKLAQTARDFCNEKIAELTKEKLELSIDPVANKDRLAEIEKELEYYTNRREANIEIITKGEEKLKEIEEKKKEIEEIKSNINIQYENDGIEVDFEQLIREKEFKAKFGVELLHDDVDKATKYIKDKIENLPKEIEVKEQELIKPGISKDAKDKLVNEINALREQQEMMPILLEYTTKTGQLEKSQEMIEFHRATLKALEEQISEMEWKKKNEGPLTEKDTQALQSYKNSYKDLEGTIKEAEKSQSKLNEEIKNLDPSMVAKIKEYLDSEGVDSGLIEALQTANKTIEQIPDEKQVEVDLDTEQAQTKVENLNSEVDNSVEGAKDFSDAFNNTNLSHIEEGLENASENSEKTKENIEAVAETTEQVAQQSFANLGNILVEKLSEARNSLMNLAGVANNAVSNAFKTSTNTFIEGLNNARQKILDIANVARNYGTNALKSMAEGLTKALNGSRAKLIDVANVARNYGASAFASMGNALLSKLNSARASILSIANIARNIKIPTPTASGGARGLGGLLMASSNSYSLPNYSIRSLPGIAQTNSNTSSNNAFNFNIDRVVVDRNTDIKKTAKQFTIMCQRQGVLI